MIGSTYHKVANRHKQQQYKEWAQIIGDVVQILKSQCPSIFTIKSHYGPLTFENSYQVQQWDKTKRTEWERQFYWIHILTPRKYAASSSAAISLGDHGTKF